MQMCKCRQTSFITPLTGSETVSSWVLTKMVVYLHSVFVENEATVIKQAWEKAAVVLKTICKLFLSVEMRFISLL